MRAGPVASTLSGTPTNTVATMPVYDRSAPENPHITEFDDGIEWLAHPDETGQRASHLIDGPAGPWLIDPLDIPALDERIDTFGELAGIAVLSNYHARDADTIAARHDVAVTVPPWVDRAADRLDAPLERATTLGKSGFELTRYNPVPGYDEAIAYREHDGALYVPDALGTAPFFTVGEERLACYGIIRLRPPRELFASFEPERILVGHGTGVFTDATAALQDALDGARRRLPTAIRRHGLTQVRGVLAALGR